MGMLDSSDMMSRGVSYKGSYFLRELELVHIVVLEGRYNVTRT